ncbi:MAG: alginate export family protein, partial [Planctomycetes bacterium]|nr:alginate export family protein [Planctomycetota bacterium]
LGITYRLALSRTLSNPSFYVQFQDARGWLSELPRKDFSPTCPYFDQFDLRQAYVEWHEIGGSPLGFKIGRQAICYGDHRVFGPGNWGNTGRYWWDAAKAFIETDLAQVDFIYGRRVICESVRFDKRHYDFHMLAVYAQIKKLPFRLDTFYVLRYNGRGEAVGESGRGDRSTNSVGFYIDGTAGRWDYGGTAVGQFGKFGKDDICAFGGNARLGYTFDAPWKPRLAAQFSYGSGDGDPRDGRHGTFDGVFGSVDTLYGLMILTPWMNIEDYQLTAGVQPAKGLKVWVDGHFFRLASDRDAWYWANGKPVRRDASGTLGQTIGAEIDLLAKWRINPHWQLFAGYCHFFPGTFVLEMPNERNDPADWLFAQVTFSF